LRLLSSLVPLLVLGNDFIASGTGLSHQLFGSLLDLLLLFVQACDLGLISSLNLLPGVDRFLGTLLLRGSL